MPKNTWSNYKRSGIRVDPPPLFFQNSHIFPLFFFGNVPYLELSVGHPVLEISSAHTCWSGLLPRMQPPVGERRRKPWRMSSRSTRFLSTGFGRLLGNVTIGHHGGHQYFLNRNILLVSSPTPLSGKPRIQTGGGWRKPPCTSESAQKGEELIKPKKGVGMIGGGCLIVEE